MKSMLPPTKLSSKSKVCVVYFFPILSPGASAAASAMAIAADRCMQLICMVAMHLAIQPARTLRAPSLCMHVRDGQRRYFFRPYRENGAFETDCNSSKAVRRRAPFCL